MILIDTNVLIDLASDDPVWGDWSEASLETASLAGRLAVNGVVYAELAVRYRTIEELDEFLALAEIDLVSTPKQALFLAGRVYGQYRQSGGTRTGVLPDFFIGAHAAVWGAPLLTRDVRRYRTYFPTVELIAP